MGDAFGAAGEAHRLLAFLDIGGRPDGVEGLVQAEPRIDVARKFVGLGDDRLERRADERIAVRLAAGQGARIAAKEWQVRSEFLAKRHDLMVSRIWTWRCLWRCATPWQGCGMEVTRSAPSLSSSLEQSSGDLVSGPGGSLVASAFSCQRGRP